MNSTPKLLLAGALALSLVQMPLLASETIEPSDVVSISDSNSNKPPINQNKPTKEKRKVSALRIYWNIAIKSPLAVIILSSGLALLPFSLRQLNYCNDPEIIAVARLGLIGSPLLMFAGYTVLQNSFDSIRDEFTKTYFDTSNPNQI